MGPKSAEYLLQQIMHFYAGQQRHLTFYIVLCFFHYCHQRGIPLSGSSWSPESRTEKGFQSFLLDTHHVAESCSTNNEHDQLSIPIRAQVKGHLN